MEARPTRWIRSGWRQILSCEIAQVLAWADACWRSEAELPLLVYSTAEPAEVARPTHNWASPSRVQLSSRPCRRWRARSSNAA